MNAITTIEQAPAAVNALMPHTIDEAMRLASFMARAKTVPAHLQDSPGDCLMVIEAAQRWQMSPFAVAQCTSVIQGKLMFEGKLVAAVVESSGAIVGHLDYRFSGTGAERSITVSAVRRGETEPRSVTVALKDARTNNGMWTRQPDQQLVYHGSRVWARRWLPAVMLGVYSPEEMTVEPAPTFAGTTIEAEAEQAAEPAQQAPRKRTVGEWLDDLEIRLLASQTTEDVDAITGSDDVRAAQTALRNGALERLNSMVSTALARVNGPAPEYPHDERTNAEADELHLP